MNRHFLFLISSVLLLNFTSACVTRRALNQQSSQGSESSADNSDSSPENSAPVVTQKEAPSGAVAAPSSAYEVEELKAEMAKLLGRLDELEQENRKLQSKSEELEKIVKATPAPSMTPSLSPGEPEAAATPVPSTTTENKDVGTAEKGKGESNSQDPFALGKAAYEKGNFEEAARQFTFFLEKDGKSKASKALAEAVFLRAESFFQTKNYKQAIVDYSVFPEKYQKSPYFLKALLKIAESFENMGRIEDADAFYQDLADQHPKTAEGKLAKKRLKQRKKK